MEQKKQDYSNNPYINESQSLYPTLPQQQENEQVTPLVYQQPDFNQNYQIQPQFNETYGQQQFQEGGNSYSGSFGQNQQFQEGGNSYSGSFGQNQTQQFNQGYGQNQGGSQYSGSFGKDTPVIVNPYQ